MSAPLKLIDGTVTLPSLTFNSESSSGLFRPSSGQIGVVASGVEVLRVKSNGAVMIGTSNDLGAKLNVIGTSQLQGAVTITGAASVTGDVSMSSQNGGQLAGMRNRIINGDMRVWQRGTTGTSSNSFGAGNTAGHVSADRWWAQVFAGSSGSGTCTFTTSQQAFTAGQTAVPGEPKYFTRVQATSLGVQGGSSSIVRVHQAIEGVSNFAGQTATFSFYAKADTARTYAFLATQIFGSGGSPSAKTAVGQTIAVTSAWQKFSVTLAIPSIAGKTVGTNGDDYLGFTFILYKQDNTAFNDSLGAVGTYATNMYLDFTQAQAELGSVATPFEQRSIGLELSLCQRYYQVYSGLSYAAYLAATDSVFCPFLFQPAMRTTPISAQLSAGTPNPAVVTVNISPTNNTLGQLQINANSAAITGVARVFVSGFGFSFSAEL
jgi:hypothetical protein